MINTTEDIIIGIKNFNNDQLIFYDTPGSNFLKTKKKFKSIIWESIEKADYILYLIDSFKYNFNTISADLNIINNYKATICVFNKIDLLKKENVLKYIKEIDKDYSIDAFFNISSKYNKGIKYLIKYLSSKAVKRDWIFNSDEITNKDDIFIANETTRNAILNFLHQEIPYNLSVRNLIFKQLKNKNIKIKQSIDLDNKRYMPIILGKKGKTIKKIRETSQKQISKILNAKIHLYLEVNISND